MYDIKCSLLAKAFLEDMPTHQTAAEQGSLAQAIQDAIEDWIDSNIPIEDRA